MNYFAADSIGRTMHLLHLSQKPKLQHCPQLLPALLLQKPSSLSHGCLQGNLWDASAEMEVLLGFAT